MESHGHFTRRSVNNLFVPRVKSFGFTSFVYTSIIEWNKLPNDIKILQNRCIYKSKLKSYLLNLVVLDENSIFQY